MTRRFLNKLSDYAPTRHLVALVAACALAVSGCVGDATPGASGNAAGTAAGSTAGSSAGNTAGDASGNTARSVARGASAPADSAARHSADSTAALAAVRDTAMARRLSPAADSLAPYLVFAPTGERAFVAAVRNQRWLLDVGRVDLDVRKDSTRMRAFREAARVVSPVPARAVFRLFWARGAEDVVVDSFAVYNGRIVMRLFGSAVLDSVASRKGTFAALAVRADSAAAPVATACDLRIEPDSATRAATVVALAAMKPAARRAQAAARRSADRAFDARVVFVRDSLEAELRLERPPYERLYRRTKLAVSQARGCFGAARRALVVSLRAGDAEWVRERLVLIAPDGTVTALRVDDGRFRAHDLLTVFDADGDGVDDLATRGTTQRAGGTAILRIDLMKQRAERLAAGFAWEVF